MKTIRQYIIQALPSFGHTTIQGVVWNVRASQKFEKQTPSPVVSIRKTLYRMAARGLIEKVGPGKFQAIQPKQSNSVGFNLPPSAKPVVNEWPERPTNIDTANFRIPGSNRTTIDKLYPKFKMVSSGDRKSALDDIEGKIDTLTKQVKILRAERKVLIAQKALEEARRA